MTKLKTYKILSLLLIAQWAFVKIIAQFPDFIEQFYSKGLYVFISSLLRILLGWIPFSVGDVFYIVIVVVILKIGYLFFKNNSYNFKITAYRFGSLISVVFFAFYFFWGLNYFRTPLNKRLNISNESYSNEELIDFTQKLISKINEVQLQITKNDSIVVLNPNSKSEIEQQVTDAYLQLAMEYPTFSYKHPSIKKSIFSLPLTYMGFAGYLNPFTNEAQVNAQIPKNTYPATLCHETAHQIGIASESEANFTGYLASIHAKNIYFNYAGYLMALQYALFEVYNYNPDTFKSLITTIHKGILKDMQQNQNFWNTYKNWSQKYFKTFYDSYLKANKQKEGIRSYNKMVLWLINYHKIKKI